MKQSTKSSYIMNIILSGENAMICHGPATALAKNAPQHLYHTRHLSYLLSLNDFQCAFTPAPSRAF